MNNVSGDGTNPHGFYIVNCPNFFVSHRLILAKALKEAGAEATVVAPSDHPRAIDRIRHTGVDFVPSPMSRVSNSLMSIARAGAQAWQLAMRQPKAIFHLITIKPILFYGLLLRLLNRRLVIAISGLGTVFHNRSLKFRFLKPLIQQIYQFIFTGRNTVVIVQNHDDRRILNDLGVEEDKLILIKGSGVDPSQFPFSPRDTLDQPLRILVPARLLRDKGIIEACHVSAKLTDLGVQHQMWFAGTIDRGNPTSLTDGEVQELSQRFPQVRFLGHVEDVCAKLSEADMVCFPSHHEGLPKALVEAFSVGRPVVSFDVPGCRELVHHHRTGLLAKKGDINEMANHLARLAADDTMRRKLVEGAHRFFQDQLAQDIVIRKTMAVYQQLMGKAL